MSGNTKGLAIVSVQAKPDEDSNPHIEMSDANMASAKHQNAPDIQNGLQNHAEDQNDLEPIVEESNANAYYTTNKKLLNEDVEHEPDLFDHKGPSLNHSFDDVEEENVRTFEPVK